MNRLRRKVIRNITIRIAYSEPEWNALKLEYAKSSLRTINTYIRELSLKSPFTIYNNRAFDGFVDEVVLLRKEMQLIGGKVVLTKEDELRLIHVYEEIKNSINKLIDLCMQQ